MESTLAFATAFESENSDGPVRGNLDRGGRGRGELRAEEWTRGCQTRRQAVAATATAAAAVDAARG